MLTVYFSRHKGFRRVIRDQLPVEPQPSSNDNDSMKPNFGEEVRSRSPGVRTSINTSTHLPGKRIDDIGKLTLDQGYMADSSTAAQQPASPPSNPLKRGPLTDSGFPEPLANDSPKQIRTRTYHRKSQSKGSTLEREPDHEHERPPTVDPEFTRKSYGSSRRLFDPERDSPFSNLGNTKDKRLEKSRAPAMVFVESDDFRAQPRAKLRNRDPQQIFETNRYSNMLGNKPNENKLDEKDQSAIPPTPGSDADQEMETDMEPILLLQPETRPISHEQLVVEVKGIFAGLVMVESKCIDVDEKQLNAALEKDQSHRTKLSDEQWQALIHLHKTLLHEHHDFFLASQHPSASPALSDLAIRCSMPLRMSRHGIYDFLKVLRHRLPESREHMLAFIYIAYSMVALLYETVPTFENTWIECLGDLARYRLFVEADDPLDREVWNGVARLWYSKAIDRNPQFGHFYHHLAVLARQYSLQQLSLFTQSLTCLTPYESAREAIKSLFRPVLNDKAPINPRSSTFETIFVKAHGVLFSGSCVSQFHAFVHQIKNGLLDSYIGCVTSIFKEQGVYVMITNIGALFEYGTLRDQNLPRSIFRLAFEESRRLNASENHDQSQTPNGTILDVNRLTKTDNRSQSPKAPYLVESLSPAEYKSSTAMISLASELTFSVLAVALRRIGDGNVYPLVHVALVFLYSLASVDEAMRYVEKDVPWDLICSFLSALAKAETLTARVWATEFPKPENGIGKPLPEDYSLRGQEYTACFCPDMWFSAAMIDEEERRMELPSIAEHRVERMLWLGVRIASVRRYLNFPYSPSYL